jgi:hypothetical protein
VPGRYGHNPDPQLAELLHQVTLEGWGNDSVGDVDQDGFYASLLIVEPAEQSELTDAFDQTIPSGTGSSPRTSKASSPWTSTQPRRPPDKHSLTSPTWTVPEDDGTITPAGPLGSRYAVALGGRFLGYATDLDQATAMLQDAMATDRYWPDA